MNEILNKPYTQIVCKKPVQRDIVLMYAVGQGKHVSDAIYKVNQYPIHLFLFGPNVGWTDHQDRIGDKISFAEFVRLKHKDEITQHQPGDDCPHCEGEGVIHNSEDRWSNISGHYTEDWTEECQFNNTYCNQGALAEYNAVCPDHGGESMSYEYDKSGPYLTLDCSKCEEEE